MDYTIRRNGGNDLEARRKQERSERLRTGVCAFLLPAVLFATVLAAIGIFPFGEKSLLIIDMNSEYVDYLAQMNESLRTGQSLTRSWNMGMGLNMLGLIAFYTSSPFNILVMLFPVEVITEVLFAVTLLKVGLAGLLYSLYTEYTLGRRGLFAVVFSVAYALCAYNIAYASNIMWLDGAAFLPLVLLGAEKILRENRCGIFLGSLVYVFFTSYYIGYMIGAFSFLYFTAVYFSRPGSLGVLWRKLGRFMGCAVLAAGCCAFLLLPAFLNLRSGQSAMWDIPVSFALEKSFVRLFSRMLPGVYDSLTDSGYPNIFCTVLGLLCCVLYFLHKGATRREKVVFGGLLALLALSFSCSILDLAWHAFEDPTWFPARYSFVFCFLVLYLAMNCLNRLDTMSPAGVAGGILVLAALIAEVGIGRFRYVETGSLLAAGSLLALYGLLWWWQRRGDGEAKNFTAKKGWPLTLVLLLVCAEVWANAYVMERGLDNQFGYKTRESYTAYRAKYLPAVNSVAAEDDSVYRLEVVEQRNANGGMALGYNGISHYSTTTDQPLNGLLRRLGYNKGTSNELRFTPNTPVTGGLMGIRYVLSAAEMGGGYETMGAVGDVVVNRNGCAFPLAYAAGASALDWEDGDENPFALQNSMLSALFDRRVEVFSPVPDVEYLLHNVDLEEKDGYLEYTPRVRGEAATVEFWLRNPDGREAYAYFPVWNNKFSAAEVLVNGVSMGTDLHYRGNAVLPLGAGEDIHVMLDLGNTPTRIREQYFYTLDTALAGDLAREAGENALDFTRFTDTRVDGTVNIGEGGALVTTFPFDSGWRVTVDGKRTEPGRFAGVFLALELPPGEHTISMRYSPPGFAVGCAVSVMCAAGILLVWLRRRYVSRKQ